MTQAHQAFAGRPPNEEEVEVLRLLLSTFQDGTGQERGGTLPGWRDYERASALTFGGEALEAKAVFDVLVPLTSGRGRYGISCKMKNGLDKANEKSKPGVIDTRGRAYLELSNSAGDFWAELGKLGLYPENYRDGSHPQKAGEALVSLVESWHERDATTYSVDLSRSYHVVLLYSTKAGEYQLFQYPLALPAASELKWYCPMVKRKGEMVQAKHIKGVSAEGIVFEWYGESGAQLKYYPKISDALWRSEVFELEPLSDEVERGLLAKAAQYFPQEWEAVFKKIERR